MIRKNLESYTGKNIDKNTYMVAVTMATSDIKANKVNFNKKTSLKETIKITSMCLSAIERCR